MYVSNAGKMVYSNGDVYDGEWRNDARSGFGTYQWTSKGQTYVGQFENGTFHGTGEIYAEDDSERPRYSGRFAAGRKRGAGFMRLSNGDLYKGQFENDLFHGQGVLEDSCGNAYNGSFADGLRQGRGRQEWSNGMTYEGDFNSGRPNGSGNVEYPDGSVVAADFVGGRKLQL